MQTFRSSTATRRRLEAVRNARRADNAGLPYRWMRVRRDDGLWSIVVRVNATGKQLRISYASQPTDDDAERIAARLYRLATGQEGQ